MKTFKPDKNTLYLWQIRVLLITILLVVLCVWAKSFVSFFVYLSVVFAVFGALAAFVYFPKYFDRYEVSVTENALIIKSGILLKHERIMPNPRLVYIERYYTPLSRCFGVCGLILHTTRAATFTAEMSQHDIGKIMEAIHGEV